MRSVCLRARFEFLLNFAPPEHHGVEIQRHQHVKMAAPGMSINRTSLDDLKAHDWGEDGEAAGRGPRPGTLAATVICG